ncbi:hypothetical protein Ahy_B10g104254 [Arachis hypogaea]|uniref:Protein FAR1-RELATED SEQUENCE n=1 Tax=Arachis hypogaea TaxID=3818 RepID=A0A444X523_ARAHY|nr:hypothetical protein Ahy_B10g104254 [Arachis hypogaea]
MSHVVWNSLTKESFDRNWNDFLMKYGLGDNKRLLGLTDVVNFSMCFDCAVKVSYCMFFDVFLELFKNRHLWILVYVDHHFWAGMRSTQRSEIMHAFFNKFIMHNSLLIQFIKQYDNFLGSRERERESDISNFHIVIPCAKKSSIEAQFQHVYTHKKFRKVQAQFREGELHHKINALQSRLYEQVSNSTFNKFVVTYDRISIEVKCQCLLFESRRILYRHSLSTLRFERVNKVSPRYILERWSKNVKRRHKHIKSSHDEPLLETNICIRI